MLDGSIEIKQILRMNESGPSLLEICHKNQYILQCKYISISCFKIRYYFGKYLERVI
jgi:hypothetical protein